MEELTNLTTQLISIPSVTSDRESNDRVLQVCEKYLQGFTIEWFEKNGVKSLLIHNQPVGHKEFKIILDAHLDVVAAKPHQFHPEIKNGRIYGRGAQDMKAGAAVEIEVFKNMAKKVTYPLALQLVTDEEVGGFNAAKHQVDQGIRGEFVIAGEPTDFGINNQAKGIVWATVRAKGAAAHGAYVWNGKNALRALIPFLNNLEREFPVPEKETWITTVNVARIETSNQTFNKVPDDAIVSLDIRYVPADSDTIIEKLKSLVPPELELEILVKEPSQFTRMDDPFIKKLSEATTHITGSTPEVINKHGGSDIRHFNGVGCNGVTFGPIGAGLHTDEEWVDIASLTTYYKILEQFLTSLN